MGGDDFPDKIQVWRSTATLEYCGTWSTTRYPKDAVTYRRVLPAADHPLADDARRALDADDVYGWINSLPAAPAEDVRAGALKEAEQICRTLGVLGGVTPNPYADWKTHADNLAAAILELIENADK